jgi:hypothetical protein
MCSYNSSQFAYLLNQTCVDYCPDALYADISTRTCVKKCPIGQFYQIWNQSGTIVRICTDKCYPNYYANISGICVVASECPSSPVKYYGDSLSGKCVTKCP